MPCDKGDGEKYGHQVSKRTMIRGLRHTHVDRLVARHNSRVHRREIADLLRRVMRQVVDLEWNKRRLLVAHVAEPLERRASGRSVVAAHQVKR